MSAWMMGGVNGATCAPAWPKLSALETEIMPIDDVDRERLGRRLKEERVRTIRLLGQLVADQSAASEQDRAGDLTKMPFHIADLGSDAMEAELAASNATRLSNELAAIDDALERLYHAPEHFGICEDTGAEIPLARLDVIPWARTCEEAGA